MVVTAVITAKADKTAAVQDFLKTFKQVEVYSVKGNEILIVIDAAEEFIESFSDTALKNDDIITFLHHSCHFI
ncbi:MAG: hypothetical protein LBP51_05445 [Deferribacteraceae bacterium]|jgi:nitrate reductase NapAB chaperone NapD|nr:hypothetical protein [Deferribacteraceae bacterium]